MVASQEKERHKMAKHLEKERRYGMGRPRSHSFDDRRLPSEHSPYWADQDLELPHHRPEFDQGSWTSSSSYFTAVIPETRHAHGLTHEASHQTGYLFPGHGAE